MNTLHRGLTVVELVVTLAIVSILLISSVPTFSSLIDNSRRAAEANDMLGFFVLARQQSILSGRVVTVCPVNSEGKCSRDWNTPLYAFYDTGNQRQIENDTDVFRILPTPGSGTRKARSLSRSYFQYRPNGMIFSDLGNITWCPDDQNSENAAHLVISRGGRIRLARDTNGDGIPNKANGDNVSC